MPAHETRGCRGRVLIAASLAGTILALAVAGPLRAEPPAGQAAGAKATIPFDEAHWDLTNASVSEHLGRTSLTGMAMLRDFEFADGTIEVDLAVDGRRSYPGILFRAQPDSQAQASGAPREPQNGERLYLRPHRAGLYPDAIQYAPVFNGVTGWQLYNGEGCTAGIELPTGEWVHLRLEVQGSQARFFVGPGGDPALVIPELKHGLSRGGLGLYGPQDGTAYFSNFSFAPDAGPAWTAPPERVTPPGTLTHWEISQSVQTARFRRERYPHFYTIFSAGWEPAPVEADGLVDVSRLRPRQDGGEADCVLARTIFHADSAQQIKLTFGYSDDIHLYHNGRFVYAGRNGYRSRDASHVGVVGLFDTVPLTLEPGLNEILCYLSESFGGWGFRFQADQELAPPLREHDRATPVWATPDSFLTPESVLYDAERRVLYVSSFDNQYTRREAPSGFISRVTLEGEIADLHWATGLSAPCGMALHQDRLFTVERTCLTEIDTGSGRVVARYPLPGVAFPNDLAIDAGGTAYISDTGPTGQDRGCLYRCRDGVCERWLESPEIIRPNGLLLDGRELLVGNTGDGSLKAVDLESGCVRRVVGLGAGVVDGIRACGAGQYLVSHWEGQAYLRGRDGRLVEILDTMAAGDNCADFEFVTDSALLVVPTFVSNRIMAYRVALD